MQGLSNENKEIFNSRNILLTQLKSQNMILVNMKILILWK